MGNNSPVFFSRNRSISLSVVDVHLHMYDGRVAWNLASRDVAGLNLGSDRMSDISDNLSLPSK